MEIRKLLECDAPNVSEIYALSWKAAYKGIIPQKYLDELSLERWIPFLKVSPSSSHILLNGDHYIGTSAVSKAREEQMNGWGEIISLYVLPQYFGEGYGKQLFLHAIKDLKEQGYDKIYLWVLEENSRARAFYERHGFSPTKDTITIEIGGKVLTEMRYVNDVVL